MVMRFQFSLNHCTPRYYGVFYEHEWMMRVDEGRMDDEGLERMRV